MHVYLQILKKLLLPITFCFGFYFCEAQGVFSANTSGDWTAAIWTRDSGTDDDDIPDGDDDASTAGFDIAVTTAVEVNDFTINNGSDLNITAGSFLSNNSVTVNSGGSIILDGVDLSNNTGTANQFTVESGGKITVIDNTAFPDHDFTDLSLLTYNVVDMQAGSTSEFNVGTGLDVNVLLENAFNYRNVVLSGVGAKTLVNSIATLSGPIVNDLTVEEGTFILDAAVTSIIGIVGTITVKSGATLLIEGAPTFPAGANFDFQDGSKVIYTSASAQTILGGVSYYDLEFSGTGIKTTGAAFSVRNEMSFSSDVGELELDDDITLESDASGTAFISEIPSGYVFDYAGGGEFVCERYFVTTALDYLNASENYRDFSLPLIAADALLSQFDDDNETAGATYLDNLVELPIFGVPDSKYPSTGSNNVSDFNSTSGSFGTPASYNNSIVLDNGSAITSNAVRFGWASTTGLTIMARGEINAGDVDFNVKKGTFNEFNMLGNPYPCAIDFEKIVTGNATPFSNDNIVDGISQIFYVIGPDAFGANGVGFYNAYTNASSSGVTKDIPAFQGFMLEVIGANADYDFTISESHKTALNVDTYKSARTESSPEMMSIKVYENNSPKDQIHYYFFEGGTNSFERGLDVNKVAPKVTALKGAQLDFYDGKDKMNLLANATSDKEDMNLQFVVTNPDAKNIELELTNLSHLLSIYNCIYIENKRTGEIHSVSGDFLTIDVEAITEEIFIIKTVSAPDLFEINSSDATCHGLEDGLIRVDMSHLPENSPVTVLKNNAPFETFNSSQSVYKKTVGAGLYEFRIQGLTESCTYVYRETIEDEDEVIANFEISDSLFAEAEVTFRSTAANTTVNEWLTSLGETIYGDTISLSYDNPGRYWVKLTAIGEYEHCKDEELKFFDIAPAVSGVGVGETDFFDGVKIFTTVKELRIVNIPTHTEIELISSEGKLLGFKNETNGVATFTNLNNASYIVRMTNSKKSASYRIGLK